MTLPHIDAHGVDVLYQQIQAADCFHEVRHIRHGLYAVLRLGKGIADLFFKLFRFFFQFRNSGMVLARVGIFLCFFCGAGIEFFCVMAVKGRSFLCFFNNLSKPGKFRFVNFVFPPLRFEEVLLPVPDRSFAEVFLGCPAIPVNHEQESLLARWGNKRAVRHFFVGNTIEKPLVRYLPKTK